MSVLWYTHFSRYNSRCSTRYQRVRSSLRTTTHSTRLYYPVSTQSSLGWATTRKVVENTPFARCTGVQLGTRLTPTWSRLSCPENSTSCGSRVRTIPMSCVSSGIWRPRKMARMGSGAKTLTPIVLEPGTTRPSGRTRRCSPHTRTSTNSYTPGSCRIIKVKYH